MVGSITYSYTPDDWNQDQFVALGGFTVVFLNYNKAGFIEMSVPSALNQDFPLLEMFFMDDASTDGSGDTMESIVRGYRGRHKVTVVRNTENQYITGQWNIVSKLATGRWLGMFCGDDVSHLDRVSQVAKLIKETPTLKGLTTAALNIDGETGKVIEEIPLRLGERYFERGDMSWESLCAGFKSTGCASFWHKSLFDEDLPRVPLDDDYLHFRLIVLNKGRPYPVYLNDQTLKTLDYRVGVGVCGAGIRLQSKNSSRGRWILDRKQHKKYLLLYSMTISKCVDYALQHGIKESDMSPYSLSAAICKIQGESTTGRVVYLPKLIKIVGNPCYTGAQRIRVVRKFFYYFFSEFFGVGLLSRCRIILKYILEERVREESSSK